MYEAIKGAKTKIVKTGDYITITGEPTDNLTGTTYTIGLDSQKITSDIGSDSTTDKLVTASGVVEYLKNSGSPELKYKANNGAEKKITLKNAALVFENGKNTTAAIESSGNIKINLNKALSEISTITGENGSGSLTFRENKLITTNGKIQLGESGAIVVNDKNAVTGDAVKAALTEVTNTDGTITVSPSVTNTTGKTTYDIKLASTLNNTLTALGKSTIKISGDNTKTNSGSETDTAIINKKLSEGLNIAIKGAANSGVTTKVGTDTIEISVEKATTINDSTSEGTANAPSDNKFATEKAVADYVKTKTENLNPDIAISANGKDADNASEKKTKIALNKGLNFVNGDNTTASITKEGNISFALKKELEGITSIGGTGTTSGKITFGDRGAEGSKNPTVQFNNAVLTGIAKGTADSDAVNVKQLKDLGIEDGKPVVTYDDSGKTKVTLAGNGGTTLAGLKDGSVIKGSNQAVTGGQLHTLETVLGTTNLAAPTFTNKATTFATAIEKNTSEITTLGNKTIQLGGDGNSHTTAKTLSSLSEDTFVIKGVENSGITTKADKDNITIDIAKTTKSDDIKNAANTTNASTFTRAIDVKGYVDSEISTVTNKITDAEIAYKKKDDKEVKKVKLTDGFTFDKDNNLTLDVNADGAIKYGLNKTLTGITSISGGDNKGQLSFDDNSVIKANGKVELTTSGNVATEDNFAVTGAAVKAALTEVKNVDSDDSITITPTTPTTTGKTTYKLALKSTYKSKLDNLAADPENTYVNKTDFSSGHGINVDNWKTTLGVNNLELAYSANGDSATESSSTPKAKTTTLSKGLKFNGDKNLTITTGEEKGVINYSLNSTLKGITSINNQATGGTAITIDDSSVDFGGRSINNFTSGAISDGNTKAVSGDTVYDYLTGNYYNKSGVENLLTGYITAETANNSYLNKGYAINLAGDSGAGVLTFSENPTLMIKGTENIKTKATDGTVMLKIDDKPIFKGINVADVTIRSKQDIAPDVAKKLEGLEPEERKAKLKELGYDGTEPGIIHAAGYKIAHIADGDIAEGSKAAVNGGQLYGVEKIAKKGVSEAETANKLAKTANDLATTNKTDIGNLTTRVGNTEIDIGKIKGTVSSHTADINGLKIDVGANKIKITEGIKIDADERADNFSEPLKKNLGETIKIAGSKNLTTTLSKEGVIVVNLNDSLSFNRGTEKQPLTLTINNNGKISGLANGIENSDAVNMGQLNPAITALGLKKGKDGTITGPIYNIGDGTANTIQDAFTKLYTKANGTIKFKTGSTDEINVALGDTVKYNVVSDFATKLLTIDLDKINNNFKFNIEDSPVFKGKVSAKNGFDAGGKIISNVGTGNADTDAVNVSQLRDVENKIKETQGETAKFSLDSPVVYIVETKNKTDDSIVKREQVVRVDGKYYRREDIDPVSLKPKVIDGVVTSPVEFGEIENTRKINKLKIATLDKAQNLTNKLEFTNVAAGDISSSSTDAINGAQILPILNTLGMTWDNVTNEIDKPKWHIGKETYDSIASIITAGITGELGTTVLTDINGDKITRIAGEGFYKIDDLDRNALKKENKIVLKKEILEEIEKAKTTAGEDTAAQEAAVEKVKNKYRVAPNNIMLSALNPETGKATTPLRFGNIADAIADNDAINLKQLKAIGIDPTLAIKQQVVLYDGENKDIITLGGTAITPETLKSGGTKITNLKQGELNATSSDAVTGAQLFAEKERIKEVEKSWNIGYNDVVPHKVNFGDKVIFKGSDNITLLGKDTKDKDGATIHTLSVDLSKNISIGDIKIHNIETTISSAELDGTKTKKTESTITGLTNKSWTGTPITGRAATEDQLKSAVDLINKSTSTADQYLVKYAINTGKEAGKDTPNYGLITLRGAEENDSTTSTSKKNIGTKITNLKAGDITSASKDAINGAQLYDYASILGKALGGATAIDASGKLKQFEVTINDNNGVPGRKVTNIREAIEDLNNGWRITAGKTPVGATFDGIAGATNVKRGQTFGILAKQGGNISTEVKKKEVSFFKEYASNLVEIKDNKVVLKSDQTKELDGIFTDANGEKVELKNVVFHEGKAYKKGDNSFEDSLNLVAGREKTTSKMELSYVDVQFKEHPEFTGITVEGEGVTIKGKSSTVGAKETTIAINTDGKGTITGLTNKKINGTTELSNLTSKDVDELEITMGRAATEDQLKEVIVDYVTRDSANIKYDDENHNKVTLGTATITDGVALTNVKAGKDGKDAANMDQIIRLVAGDQSKVTDTGKKVEYDTENKNWKNIEYTKLHKVDGSEEIAPTNILSAINANAGKIDSGITFGGTIGDGSNPKNKKQYLGSELNIVSASSTINNNSIDYVGENLITKYTNSNGNGTISIGFKETPKFKGVIVGEDGENKKKAILTTNDNGNLVIKNGADGKDGIDGTSGKISEIVTRELLENEGLISKNSEKGKDGINGPAGRNGEEGPAGKDGISGANINEKVNALRSGEAGTVVYTTDEGERVVRDGNKFYLASDLVGKVKDELGDWYPVNSSDGQPNKHLDKINPLSADKVAKIQLSAVSKEGSTLLLTTLGNIKSNIFINEDVTNIENQLIGELEKLATANGELTNKEKELAKAKEALEKIGEDGPDKQAAEEAVKVANNSLEAAKENVKTLKDEINATGEKLNSTLLGIYPIDEDSAKTAIGTLYSKNRLELFKVATVGELQVVAQAGLDFGANGNPKAGETGTIENNSIHRKLGDKLGILGGGEFTDEFTSNNLATKVKGNDIVIGFKANPEFKGVSLKDNSNTVNLKPTATNTLAFDNGNELNNEVKLTNLLSGDTKENSKDAVTGGQLYSKSKEIATLIGSKPGTEGEKAISGVTINESGNLEVVEVVPEKPASTGVEKVPASGGLDGKGSKDLVTALDKIYSEIQETTSTDALNLTYKANGNSKATTLGKGLDFTNGTNTTAEVGENGVVKFNVNKDLSGIESISRTVDKSTTKIAIEDGKVTFSKTITKDATTPATENVVLKGLKDDESDDSSAVTRGALNELAKAVGLDGKDGKDGVSGTQGRDGMDGKTIAGPAGKDGLNGTIGKDGKPGADAASLSEKINALRNGEAGTLVYVDAKGDRVIRDGSKFYQGDAVRAKDGKWYPAGTTFEADGKTPVSIDGNTPKALDGIDPTAVQLAAVSPNGETKTTATVIGNVKGTLTVNNRNVAAELNKVNTEVTDNKTNRETLADARLGGLLKLDSTTDKEALNKVATVGDLQLLAKTGLEFAANGNKTADSKLITKTLGSRTGILGGADYDTNTFNQDNIATMIDSKGDILIGMKKTPKFSGIELQEGDSKPIIKLISSGDGSKDKPTTLTIGTPKADKKEIGLVVLKGLAGGDTPDSAVTKAEFDELAARTGLAGKDGEKGDTGVAGRDGSEGAAGKDGLNGMPGKDGKDAPNLSAKINALRAGEAGSVVYTTDKGERVVRDGDNFYLAGSVKASDGNWYVKGTELNDDGSIKNSSADRAVAIKSKDIQLAAVSPDGETIAPTTLRNIAGNIALEDVATAEQELVKAQKNLTEAGTPTVELTEAVKVTEDKVKDAKLNVAKEASTKVETLVKKSGSDLNKAATVGDIQTLAVAGMNFGANGSGVAGTDATHKILGAKLGILGKSGNTFNDDYDSVNVATQVTKKGDIEIGIKKSPEFNEIVVHGEDGKFGKSAIITVDDDGNLAVKSGLNAVDGKDGIDGVNGKNAKTTEIITREYLENKGLLTSDGTTLSEKVNSINSGEAGTMVYTDEAGNRVVRDGNTFYNASKVKNYVKIDGKFYSKSDIGLDGKLVVGAKEQDLSSAKVENSNIKLSAVNPNGTTSNPTTLGNVESSIAKSDADIKKKTEDFNRASEDLSRAAVAVSEKYAKVNSYEKALENLKNAGMAENDPVYVGAKKSLEKAEKQLKEKVKVLGEKQIALNNAEEALSKAVAKVEPISVEAAKDAVLGKDNGSGTRTGGLLAAQGATLNKVATVGDLQAVAQVGLDFVTNDGEGKTIHKTLGSALKVEGKDKAVYNDKIYSSDNLVTTNDNGILRVAMLRSPMFEGVELRSSNGNNSVAITAGNDGSLNLANSTGNVVIKGVKDGDTDDSVVTKGTLDKAIKDVKGGFRIRLGGDEEKVINIGLGDTLDLGAGTNIVIAGKAKNDSKIITVAGETTTGTTPDATSGTTPTLTTLASETTVTTTANTGTGTTEISDKVPGLVKLEANAALGFKLPTEMHFNKVVLENTTDKTAPTTTITNEGVNIINKDGDRTVITPNTVTTDTVVVKKEVKVGPDKDKDGNDVPGTTTTITKDGGITVSTKSKVKDKDDKEAVKETSKVVINDGTISGLKATEKDPETGKFKEDQAVTGSALNDVIEGVRQQQVAFGEGLQQVNQRVSKLETKVNKGLANAAAMAGMNFLEIGKNQATVGAAVGGYEGVQAVAVGVQVAPTENIRVNAKVALTPGKRPTSMYSVGAAWRFNLK